MTTTSSVRRPLSRLVDDETEEENTETTSEENSEDLLSEYTKVNQPPSKKFKDDVGYDSDDEESATVEVVNETEKLKITPTRNPFKKQQPIETPDYQSPTKITGENSSLTRNHSPVKRIDYAKVEKLSKFKRTVLTEKQNVISRFFGKSSSSNESSESEANVMTNPGTSAENSKGSDVQAESNKVSVTQVGCEKNVEASKCLYLNTSKESDSESSESISAEMTTEYQQSTLNLQEKFGHKKVPKRLEITRSISNTENITEDEDTPTDLISTDESPSLASESPIILTDDEDDNNNEEREHVPTSNSLATKSLSNPKNGTQIKKQAVCRRPGLSSKVKTSSNRKGGRTAQQQTAVQSKLSMFGFQKRFVFCLFVRSNLISFFSF